MTYIIPSIIAALIVFLFARRLNMLENEETALAAMAAEPSVSSSCQEDSQSRQEDSQPAPSTQETTSRPNTETDKDDSPKEEEEEDATPQTIQTIMEILTQFGCKPIQENDHCFYVMYQGETFQFFVKGYIVDIYDLPWSEFHINDTKVPIIKAAINNANFTTTPMLLTTGPDQNGKVDILSRYQTIIHPSCTANDKIIAYILNGFFLAKQEFRKMYLDSLDHHQRQPQNRRPVGFATDVESES